jgi:hypothetical protein
MEQALSRFSGVQGFEVVPGFLENLCTSDNIYTSLLLQCGLVACVSFESPHHFTHQIHFGHIFPSTDIRGKMSFMKLQVYIRLIQLGVYNISTKLLNVIAIPLTI